MSKQRTQGLILELQKTKKITVKISDKESKLNNITKLSGKDESLNQTSTQGTVVQDRDFYIDIFDPEKFIDKSGFKVFKLFLNKKILQVSGYGTYGVIYQIIHLKTKKNYFLKYFSSHIDFAEEKDMMMKLTKVFGQNLNSITVPLENFIEEQNMLLYEGGDCSLQEFCQERLNQKIFWHENIDELNYVACSLYDIQKLLMDEMIYQSDTKPENILLQHNSKNENLSLKLIDYGVGSYKDYKKLQGVTFPYSLFNEEELLQKQKNGEQLFSSQDDREIFEYYQLGRTLLKLMIDSVNKLEEREIQLYSPILGDKNQKISFNNDEESNAQALQKLKQYYPTHMISLLSSLLLEKDIVKIDMEIADIKAKQDIKPLTDNGVIRKILIRKLQERSKNLKTEQEILKELQLCIELELPQRGLMIIEQQINNGLVVLTKNQKFVLYYAKFLNILGYKQQLEDLVTEILAELPTFELESQLQYNDLLLQLLRSPILLEEYKQKKNKSREDICKDIQKVYRAYFNQGKQTMNDYLDRINEFEKLYKDIYFVGGIYNDGTAFEDLLQDHIPYYDREIIDILQKQNYEEDEKIFKLYVEATLSTMKDQIRKIADSGFYEQQDNTFKLMETKYLDNSILYAKIRTFQMIRDGYKQGYGQFITEEDAEERIQYLIKENNFIRSIISRLYGQESKIYIFLLNLNVTMIGEFIYKKNEQTKKLGPKYKDLITKLVNDILYRQLSIKMTNSQIIEGKVFNLYEDYLINEYGMTKKDIVTNHINLAMENNKQGKYQESITHLNIASTLNNNHILRSCSDSLDYQQQEEIELKLKIMNLKLKNSQLQEHGLKIQTIQEGVKLCEGIKDAYQYDYEHFIIMLAQEYFMTEQYEDVVHELTHITNMGTYLQGKYIQLILIYEIFSHLQLMQERVESTDCFTKIQILINVSYNNELIQKIAEDLLIQFFNVTRKLRYFDAREVDLFDIVTEKLDQNNLESYQIMIIEELTLEQIHSFISHQNIDRAKFFITKISNSKNRDTLQQIKKYQVAITTMIQENLQIKVLKVLYSNCPSSQQLIIIREILASGRKSHNNNDYEEALLYFSKAYQLSKKINNQQFIVVSKNSINRVKEDLLIKQIQAKESAHRLILY